MAFSRIEVDTKTIYAGNCITVFLFENEEQFIDSAEIFYKVGACDEWDTNPNVPAIILYNQEYVPYNRETNEMVGGNIPVKFQPDFDNPCLSMQCGDDSLLVFLERLNNIGFLLENYIVKDSDELNFYNSLLHKAYTIEDFCGRLHTEFLDGLDKYYNTKDTDEGDSSFFVSKVICAYFYSEIERNIYKKYGIDDILYETCLFSNDDEIEEELSALISNTHYKSPEFIDKATDALIDADFCITTNYLDSEIHTGGKMTVRINEGLIACFDNLDDRDLIFNYESTFANLSHDFRPRNAALRLALLQNELDTYFLASLMSFMTTKFTMYMFLVDGKSTYTHTVRYLDVGSEVEIWCHFQFGLIFETANDGIYLFSEKYFETVRPFIEYTFRVWLNKSRLTFSWASSFTFEDILNGDVIVEFGEDRSILLVRYKYKRNKIG